jgi:16S rRNA (cytidine1402-2'-O)-methyltransferase
MNLQTDSPISNFKYGLYIVSTPIGNLDDISLRALKVLSNSDYILCEDTRVTKKLLTKYKIKSNLISNHKFNEKKNLIKVIDILKDGKIVSLVSDAGTPTISDPGNILIKECIKRRINVIPIPGPSAPVTALSITGFSEKYYFYGFFPEKNSEIKKNFQILSKLDSSIVFFISAKKLTKSVDIIKKYFLDRDILVAKEITKFYEEFFRYKIEDLDTKSINLKGEITLVISNKRNFNKTSNNLDESDKKKIKKLIKKLSIKEIIDLIKEGKDISKKVIYNYCLKLKNEK